MRAPLLALATIWSALSITVSAQNNSTATSTSDTCSNYGVLDAGKCSCPAGFGGAQSNNCDMPVCGGSLYKPTGVGAGKLGDVSACTCDDGWDGPSCTVCKTDAACVNTLTSYLAANGTMTLPGMNSTLVCNAQPVVYAAGQMTCEVKQAMLQALFPGRAQLTISRFLNGSSTPGGVYGLKSANIPDGAGEIWAQLWVEGIEQFSCHASGCTQTVTSGANKQNGSTWECPTLSCTCRTGTAFCGGGTLAAQNLSTQINGLVGPLSTSCTPDGNCFFNQKFLQLFGSQGLPLSGCTFGECVNQYVINNALGINASKSAGSSLSGGVIAGLAVVGAILLAIILVTAWGIVRRNKARKAAHDGSLVKKGGVGLSWSNIGYEVKGVRRGLYSRIVGWLRGVGSPARPHSPRAEDGTMTGTHGGQMVLREVCGDLPPGGFCAILGPSGAGKSTLADILAGRRKAGEVEGKVSYLSETPDRKVKIGYCDQSDVLNPTSTVLETLMFAAYLRLPENVPNSVKEERARTVLNQLGLSHIANTRVGSGEHRGISGGEMRRVSIGIELVANPDILILDEPTSGLDSVSAARIVSLLKSLTVDPDNRTTIVASIHQPSSALYHMFSQVILLANGRQLYYGPAGNTPVEFFAAQGRPCPPGYNIADHLLEVASDNDGGLRYGSDACLPTSSRNSIKEKEDGVGAPPGLANGHSRSLSVVSKEVDLAAVAATQERSSFWPHDSSVTTFLTQFEVLAGREWRMLKRDKTLFLAHFVVFAIVAVFAGGLYFHVSETISGFQNRIGALFFLGSLIAFGSLSALTLVSEMRPLFLRERACGFYSPQAWLLSRAVFDIIPLRIIPTIVLSVIVYFMVGLSLDAARFFKYLLILVEYTLAMVLYNFILGTCISHPSVAILLSSLWNLYNMTFAGFFVNIGSVPAAMRWLRYFVPLNYCLEALTVNEVPGLPIRDTLSGVPIEVTASVIMEVLFGFNLANYYRNVLVLFGFIAGFGLILIFAVIFLLREKR